MLALWLQSGFLVYSTICNYFEGQEIHYQFLGPQIDLNIEGIIRFYSFNSCFNTLYRHIMTDLWLLLQIFMRQTIICTKFMRYFLCHIHDIILHITYNTRLIPWVRQWNTLMNFSIAKSAPAVYFEAQIMALKSFDDKKLISLGTGFIVSRIKWDSTIWKNESLLL